MVLINSILIVVILYYIFRLSKQVKQLQEYYKSLKLDKNIAQAKEIQQFRKQSLKIKHDSRFRFTELQ